MIVRKEIVTECNGVRRTFNSITEFSEAIGRSLAFVSDRAKRDGEVPGNGVVYKIISINEMKYVGQHYINYKEQLCWDCKHATGGCEWSDSKGNIPVPGWEAEPSYRMGKQWSYKVISCPKFERG